MAAAGANTVLNLSIFVAFEHVSIALADAYKNGLTGPVTVEYIETFDDGTHLLAQTQAVLR